MPTPMLQAVEDKIIEALAPLVGGGPDLLRQIDVESLNSEDDLAAILERFRTRMPGAVLSTPVVSFETKPGAFRLLDATLRYRLLVGYSARRNSETRRHFAYARLEDVMRLLSQQQLGNSGIATTSPIDFVRPTSWSFAEEAELSVQLLEFEVKVRNWQVSTPA